MAITPVPTMTDTPPFPALADRAAGTYNSKAYAFGAHMSDTFNGELVAVAENVLGNATVAATSANAAAVSASAATAAAEAAVFAGDTPPWVSGTSYAQYQPVMSLLTLQSYRRRTAGAGIVDPALDSTNWRAIGRSSTFDPVAVVASDINLALGDYFTKTLSSAWSPTISNVPSGGASFTLEVQLDGGSIALPASVKVANDVMPTLAAGKTHMLMFSTRNGGARWRLTVAPNFVN